MLSPGMLMSTALRASSCCKEEQEASAYPHSCSNQGGDTPILKHSDSKFPIFMYKRMCAYCFINMQNL